MYRGRYLVLAALAVSACDMPTEAPMWEQVWVVPGEDITLGVADVLPADVTVSADGTEFETTVTGTDLEFSLGEMCTDCVALNGFIVPKPEFMYSLSSTTALPSSLVSASVTGDQFALRLAHDLNFDPLRPSSDPAAERGYIVVEISSNGAVLGRDSISGDDVVFDATTVLTPTIVIQSVDVTNTLDIDVVVFSPAGDPVQIETSDTLGIQVLPALITLSEATVEAGAITVDAPASNLNLEGIDSTLVNRVQSGALRLEVVNPFTLEGTLDLTFDLGATTIQKSITLVSGTSSPSIEFTGDELQDLLGAGEVEVTAQGTLSSPGGTITVHPEDTLIMESLFELVILVGGAGEEGNN